MGSGPAGPIRQWRFESAQQAPHWRHEQTARRRRARRLTDRGLYTLIGFLAALIGGGAFALDLPGSLEPPPEPSVVASVADETDARESEAALEASSAERPSVAAPPRIERPDAPTAVLERLPATRDVLELSVLQAPGVSAGKVGETGVHGRIVETIPWSDPSVQAPLQLEYTLDAALTREVYRVLKQGRVELGHVIVLEPDSGRVLAYASTDTERFPGTRAYPAASLVKVITAAAALDSAPKQARLPCRFTGSPYRLTPKRVDPPRDGKTVSLRKALATSNNQCFAQLAVHAVGERPLVAALERFGWSAPPAPAHAPGSIDPGQDRFELAKLGCGLAGSRITPLHAAQLAASLADGELVSPRWVDRVVDASGRELPLPAVPGPRRVMSYELARSLREMLVDTTTRGTARSAFRHRNGRPRLGQVEVAGKTGSLSGTNPKGKYEWFIGVAPADDPVLAVATVVVHGDLWWRNASQLAADVLERAFCDRGRCLPQHAERWGRSTEATAAIVGDGAVPRS